jgi:hypothetical protein
VTAPSHTPRLALLLLLAAAGCNNRQSIIVPNRVLDRPTDMVLACVIKSGDTYATTSLDQCAGALGCDDKRLIGFVANSERNDIAMFSKCSGSIVDMDIGTPGAQLIPAGQVPTYMTLTRGNPDACYAVSANLGSCDLSLLDVPGLAAYAYDEAPADDPGSLVTTLIPKRGDGTPLGARPGQVLAVPPALSNSVVFSDPLPADTTGGDDDGGDTAATDGEDALVLQCDPERPGSVYVTFPSCQLVAEIDLRTQLILQSRQFVRGDDGAVTVVDSGVDPACPIDCPDQFAGDPAALAEAPIGDADGMYPGALALVSPPDFVPGTPDEFRYDDADKQVLDHSLYVGGLGDDTLFELRYDGTQWRDDALELELQDASGISLIRPTPAMELTGGAETYHQFLYVVAGDGSTRVVRREFDVNRAELGRECDTQVDPTAVLDRVCHPAEFPGDNPPDRRPFARGPGLRGQGGSIITDWTFTKLVKCRTDDTKDEGVVDPHPPNFCLSGVTSDVDDETSALSSPFGNVGVLGVGTTSFGRLVFVTFGQFFTDANGEFARTPAVSELIDPLGVMDATILPHMLWPTLDPTIAQVDFNGLPRLEDAEPSRTLPGNRDGADALKVLSPSLRRVDLAYARDATCEASDDPDAQADQDAACADALDNDDAKCVDGECRALGAISPPIANADTLANPDAGESGATGIYQKKVARVVVRDYRAWINGDWRLTWEDQIPGSESFQGQLVCEKPGWEGGTCISTEPGDTRLVDTTARFCDKGVLAGDKLSLFPCAKDDDCGVGQYCLIDPRQPGAPNGICVSQTAYANTDYLLQVCADLLYDPCGAPAREFLITRAFEDEIWLQSLDRPVVSYLMTSDERTPGDTDTDGDPDAADGPPADVCSGEFITKVVRDPESYADVVTDAELHECQARLVCAPDQPENGCETHADCVNQSFEESDDPAAADIYPLCIDGLCRRVCDPEQEDCVLRRLPGPTCMRELVHYLVRTRDSFVLRGPSSYDFLVDRVRVGPDGECYEDPAVSNLLTSRIRLGTDEDDTRNNPAWPIPACPPGSDRPDAATPNPCFIDAPRPRELISTTPDRLYHRFDYGDANERAPVPAIRFSNPMLSLVLDLTSLLALTETIPGTERYWPTEFSRFQRSRIPRNFTEAFATRQGYAPFDVGVVTSNVALVGPTRIVNAPEPGQVYIVDSSGGAGSGSVRGQIVRVGLAGGQVTPDTDFLVR